MSSIVLRNASVLDGTGTAPFRADVLVNGQRNATGRIGSRAAIRPPIGFG